MLNGRLWVIEVLSRRSAPAICIKLEGKPSDDSATGPVKRQPTPKPGGLFHACDILRFTQRPYRYKASMNDELLEAVQDLQEQAAELDYLDDLAPEPGADFDDGDMPR